MIHSFFLRLYLCKKTILYLLDKHSIHDDVLAVNIEYIQFLNCIDLPCDAADGFRYRMKL